MLLRSDSFLGNGRSKTLTLIFHTRKTGIDLVGLSRIFESENDNEEKHSCSQKIIQKSNRRKIKE